MAEGIFGNLSSSSEKSSIGNGEKGPSDFLKLFYELTGKKKVTIIQYCSYSGAFLKGF